MMSLQDVGSASQCAIKIYHLIEQEILIESSDVCIVSEPCIVPEVLHISGYTINVAMTI